MSVSKWAYEPEKCDGAPCVGDCDLCSKAWETQKGMIMSMLDEILEHTKFQMPKHNTELRINVGGMTFEQIVWVLCYLAECLRAGCDGYKEAISEVKVPYIWANIHHESNFSWESDEDDKDTYSFSNMSLIRGIRHEGDNWHVELAPEIAEMSKEGRTVTDLMKRIAIVENGKVIGYEYPEEKQEM